VCYEVVCEAFRNLKVKESELLILTALPAADHPGKFPERSFLRSNISLVVLKPCVTSWNNAVKKEKKMTSTWR
jgi:hypothetical protein